MNTQTRFYLLALLFTLILPSCRASINGHEVYDVTPEERYFDLCKSRFMFTATFDYDLDEYVFTDVKITNRLAEWEYTEIWLGNYRLLAAVIAPLQSKNFAVKIYDGEKISVDVYYNNEMCPQSGTTFKLEL